MAGANKKLELELTRRDLLKVAGTAVGSAAVAYTVTSGPLSPFRELRRRQQTGTETPYEEARPVHWGMAIDLEKCIGCNYCTWACSAVNDLFPDKTWNIVVPERTPSGAGFFFSRPCLHCQEAHCVDVCPVGARTFGNLNDPASPVSRVLEANPHLLLREDLGTEPSVHYIPPKEGGAR